MPLLQGKMKREVALFIRCCNVSMLLKKDSDTSYMAVVTGRMERRSIHGPPRLIQVAELAGRRLAAVASRKIGASRKDIVSSYCT